MDRVVAEIPKNASEIVRIALSEFKGKPLIDVRVYFKSETGGEPKPTRKGVAINPALLPELIIALQRRPCHSCE